MAEQYARAGERQVDLRADEILQIADDASNDWMDVEVKASRMLRVLDHEHVKRSEIRIKARMWLMSRYAPRVFGERLQLDAGREMLDALKGKSDEQRLEEALDLVRQAKERVARAYADGEVTDAEFADVVEARNGRTAERCGDLLS